MYCCLAQAKATLLLMESDAALAAAQAGQVDLACVYPALSGQQVTGFTLTSLPTFGYRVISLRSEERRVGKECRSRWSPYH